MTTEKDRYLFHEGTHVRAYQFLGSQLEAGGVRFTTWAPRANRVSVVGDFNQWDGMRHQMQKISPEGIWSVFIEGLEAYTLYKYEIHSSHLGNIIKADPYARYAELRPNTASIVYPENNYQWQDADWLAQRAQGNILNKPISIYEINLASWKKQNNHHWYKYRELADVLIEYLRDHGYTHVEFMPIMEHPFDGSWGYQMTGYYAVTSRYGEPDDLKYLIDCLHQAGIGVILDWVPGHFCKDAHGLAYYDGEPLYEPGDDILRENIDWGTMNFDYARPEVRSFLISNANFWLSEFHADGLRIDAVAYMLHKHMATGRYDIFNENDYNDDAIAFIKQLNTAVFNQHQNILMMAEESSAFPLVSAPVKDGGLGFNYKWNMGWMHDTLKYFKEDPINRKHHQDKLTFSIYYAFNENFVLPLSHDEVVHGKKSILNKMPGDYWQKFANFRALMAYQCFHPGKMLNFMGTEFAQFIEWNEWEQLDWHLMQYDAHKGADDCVKALNHLYRQTPALYEIDHHHSGFEWIEFDNSDQSIIAFMRKGLAGDYVIAVFNFTPVVHHDYQIKVPAKTAYHEVFNSDADYYFGSGIVNNAPIEVYEHDQQAYIRLQLPPLGAVLIKPNDN